MIDNFYDAAAETLEKNNALDSLTSKQQRLFESLSPSLLYALTGFQECNRKAQFLVSTTISYDEDMIETPALSVHSNIPLTDYRGGDTTILENGKFNMGMGINLLVNKEGIFAETRLGCGCLTVEGEDEITRVNNAIKILKDGVEGARLELGAKALLPGDPSPI